jgi:hypothetical protein
MYYVSMLIVTESPRNTKRYQNIQHEIRTSMHISDWLIEKSPNLTYPPSPHTHRNQTFHTRRPSRNVPATSVPVYERSQLMSSEQWKKGFLRESENVLFTFFFLHMHPLPRHSSWPDFPDSILKNISAVE